MSKLLEEFNVKRNKTTYEPNDYLMFKDKALLDKFRIKILEDLSDKGFSNEHISHVLINNEIDNVTYGYSLTNAERSYLFNLIDGETNGYGPITELLNDDNVTEIMVNSPKDIYIEIDGAIKKDDSVSFINEEHIIRTIERLIEPVGKSIDVNRPMVDARLNDGSRINAIIPPLSKCPIITIRKFKKNVENIENLISSGTLTPYMGRFLSAAVEARLNILVSGSSGAGKTTILNILSNFIPESERIITIEDVREIKLRQNNVISLETRSSNYDGVGEITTRALVKNALRMRPDRIIIGEVVGSEAFDLLQAMNTGHDGSLTSIHANSPLDALKRLETLVFMDGLDVPIRAMREYIDNAIDIVIQIERMRDGRRKIVDISEVIDVKEDEFVLRNIFKWRTDGVNEQGIVQGEFKLQEYVPQVLDKIRNAGINDLDDMFDFRQNKPVQPGKEQNSNKFTTNKTNNPLPPANPKKNKEPKNPNSNPTPIADPNKENNKNNQITNINNQNNNQKDKAKDNQENKGQKEQPIQDDKQEKPEYRI